MSVIKINIIEASTELANKKLNYYVETLSAEEYYLRFPKGVIVNGDDEVRYSSKAQEIFDRYYDEYYDILLNLKEN